MNDKTESYRRRIREWEGVQRRSKASLVEAEEWIAHYSELIEAHSKEEK